jgi:hypothetical protein
MDNMITMEQWKILETSVELCEGIVCDYMMNSPVLCELWG